ncbi:hypothetical protein BDR05DRAFT_295998 [Suillus weaverae]|nr:hypothetical protein BDR05DRAFT_295998 [Suillus weaverae]
MRCNLWSFLFQSSPSQGQPLQGDRRAGGTDSKYMKYLRGFLENTDHVLVKWTWNHAKTLATSRVPPKLTNQPSPTYRRQA